MTLLNYFVLIVLPCKQQNVTYIRFTLHFIVLRHVYVYICYMHLVEDGFHIAGRGIWIIDVLMLLRM